VRRVEPRLTSTSWPGSSRTQVRLACIVIYRAGDFFFETGDISRRVNNKTSEPDTHLLFEVLPVDLKGPSLILPETNLFGRTLPGSAGASDGALGRRSSDWLSDRKEGSVPAEGIASR
jgi:hypothetical protein